VRTDCRQTRGARSTAAYRPLTVAVESVEGLSYGQRHVTAADHTTLEYRLLGPLEASRSGDVLPLGGLKPRALLAILLLNANTVVSVDTLVDELWGDSPPGDARHTVQVFISRLRKVLGREAIASRAAGYVIPLRPDQLDLSRFHDLLAEARTAPPEMASRLLRESLALFRGVPLADFTYEPFALSHIERIEETRLRAVESRVEADLELGRHAEVVPELEALARANPLREELRAQLMLALYRSGRQAEALGVYQDARRTLVDELGIDPSPKLQRLERAILQQDEQLDNPVPEAETRPASSPITRVAPEAPASDGLQREARKVVTVVFTDVVRSIELGATLDPEAVRAIMARYFEVATQALRAHGGTVDKFAGDAVMAVYGVPIVHEDDALRAVRAVVELHERMELLNDELDAQWKVRIHIRSAVNTGEVVTGDFASDRELVTGEAINVAARLEEAAEPGEILIGHETYRILGDAVQADRLEGLELRGMSSPVPAWRLVTLRPHPEERPSSPFVGRKDEIEQLRQAFIRATRSRTSCLFTVLGPAGIGKSRLAAEFRRALGDEARIVVGRCLPYGVGITFWPIGEIVRDLAGDASHEAIATVLGDEQGADRVAALIAAAIGAGSAAGSGEETFWAVRKFFEALARDRALVVLLDDVHWAEPTMLDLIDHVADWARDAPILLVCLSRPELLDARPQWGGGKLNATAVSLDPLTPDEADLLVGSLPGAEGLSKGARARIAGTAEGNPLFLEQLIAAVTEGDSAMPLPGTIQALLAARLDRLDVGERAVLEAAAVIGRDFWEGAVVELMPPTLRLDTPLLLQKLVRKDLIRPDRSALPGHSAFRFRHILIQEAARRSIPKRTRSRLHAEFAAWLEELASDRSSEYEEIVGYHLEQSFQLRRQVGLSGDENRELAARASNMLSRAGRRAFVRGDMSGAANLLGRAVELLPDAQRSLELELTLGEALRTVGDLERADSVLTGVQQAARAAGDRRLELHGELDRQLLICDVDPEFDIEQLRRSADAAVSEFASLGDHLGLAKAWRALAEVHLTTCRWGESVTALEHALAHGEEAGEPRELVLTLMYLANALYWGPTPVPAAVERCGQILAHRAAQLTVEANVLGFMGGLHALAGEFDEAFELIEHSRVLFDDLGHVSGRAALTLVSGQALLLAGKPDEAEADLRAGYNTLDEMGEKGILSSVASFLGEALAAQDRWDEAELYATVGEKAAGLDDVAPRISALVTRARARAQVGDLEGAEELARIAVALGEGTDFVLGRASAHAVLAHALRLRGRTREGETSLALALGIYGAKGATAAADVLRSSWAALELRAS
jgi:class 3 adenylate cyclase